MRGMATKLHVTLHTQGEYFATLTDIELADFLRAELGQYGWREDAAAALDALVRRAAAWKSA